MGCKFIGQPYLDKNAKREKFRALVTTEAGPGSGCVECCLPNGACVAYPSLSDCLNAGGTPLANCLEECDVCQCCGPNANCASGALKEECWAAGGYCLLPPRSCVTANVDCSSPSGCCGDAEGQGALFLGDTPRLVLNFAPLDTCSPECDQGQDDFLTCCTASNCNNCPGWLETGGLCFGGVPPFLWQCPHPCLANCLPFIRPAAQEMVFGQPGPDDPEDVLSCSEFVMERATCEDGIDCDEILEDECQAPSSTQAHKFQGHVELSEVEPSYPGWSNLRLRIFVEYFCDYGSGCFFPGQGVNFCRSYFAMEKHVFLQQPASCLSRMWAMSYLLTGSIIGGTSMCDNTGTPNQGGTEICPNPFVTSWDFADIAFGWRSN